MPNLPYRLVGKLIATMSIVLLLWLFTQVIVVNAGPQHQTIPTMPPPSATTRPTSAVSDTPTKQAPTGAILTQSTVTHLTQTLQATVGPVFGLVTSTQVVVKSATATPGGVLLPLLSPSPLITYTTTVAPVPYTEPVGNQSNNSVTYIVIGLGMLFVIVIVVWLWSKRRKSK